MIEDLSRYPHSVATHFACSTSSDDWEQYRLSKEQLEFFRENGYLKGVRVLHVLVLAPLSYQPSKIGSD